MLFARISVGEISLRGSGRSSFFSSMRTWVEFKAGNEC
jgi:hypothetical protein